MKAAVRVTVPATSANLGPGFDSLGLALSLRNEIVLRSAGRVRAAGEPIITVVAEGRGADELPTDRGNLVVQAAERVLALAHKSPERLSFRLINHVPLSSGLGSSAAAVVGGLVAANDLCGNPLPQERLLDLAVEMEGHPDNVAPALLGGFTVSVIGADGKARVLPMRVRSDVIFVFCVPRRKMQTSAARRALPASYSRADAVFSLSRAAMLVALLQGGPTDLFRPAMEDRLHQPFRFRLMPASLDACRAAERAGALSACLSGSGPTVLALVDRTASADAVGGAMARAFAAARIESEVMVLNVSRTGAHVLKV